MAVTAATAATFGNPDQPPQGVPNVTDPATLAIHGPNDPALAGTEPSFLTPPPTDVGSSPQFWSSFNLAPRRIQDGGWGRQVTQADFAISTEISGVNMRLSAGGIRELHWHQQAEWAIMTYGHCRVTVLDVVGRPAVADVKAGHDGLVDRRVAAGRRHDRTGRRTSRHRAGDAAAPSRRPWPHDTDAFDPDPDGSLDEPEDHIGIHGGVVMEDQDVLGLRRDRHLEGSLEGAGHASGSTTRGPGDPPAPVRAAHANHRQTRCRPRARPAVGRTERRATPGSRGARLPRHERRGRPGPREGARGRRWRLGIRSCNALPARRRA